MAKQKQDGLHTDVALSGADLRGKEMLFAKRDGTGKLVLCGAGDRADGVISEGRNIGAHTSINTDGNPILRVIAGAALAQNARVQSNAASQAVPGLNNSFGRVRKAVSGIGVTAEIIPDRYDADGA